MITIEGKKYKVVETLPYHCAGIQAKIVKDGDKERTAVKDNGLWRWWTTRDRL